jgi:predicted RNA-binding Zn ribbon-like protein
MTPLEEIRDFVNAGPPGELREAIRVLLRANNGVDEGVDAASRALDAASRRARLRVGFRRGALTFESDEPVLAAVAETMADGSWARLKACRADDCKWAFIDTARNRTRIWCDMAVCGNREKARRYRNKHA